MSAPSIDLVWITVADFKQAIKFYTEVVGLSLLQVHENEHMGWAELGSANGGAMLGIARSNKQDSIAPGGNACITLTVPNIQNAVTDIQKKGAKLIGNIQEVPGHVKLQLFVDPDGNFCQLVEPIDLEHKDYKEHKCDHC